jgi:hypothetical protein
MCSIKVNPLNMKTYHIFFKGSGVILESDGDIIRCCGLIKEWEIYGKKTGTLKIIVWRPTNKAGEESKRAIVGINTSIKHENF